MFLSIVRQLLEYFFLENTNNCTRGDASGEREKEAFESGEFKLYCELKWEV